MRRERGQMQRPKHKTRSPPVDDVNNLWHHGNCQRCFASTAIQIRRNALFTSPEYAVGIKTPQAAMLALDVRMGLFENDEREVVAEKTAIFLMLDSPLLTIQIILPYRRSGGRIAVSEVHYTEMPGDENASPCPIFKMFSEVPMAVC
jgi:hypothetical protein